jgi:catechol 2,3-dioxygenase-like lactoylglutathione lyase family enzyme
MPISVRYIVNDADAAIAFYSKTLGFTLDMQPGPDFARLSRGEVHLLLNRPGAIGMMADEFSKRSH